MFWSSCAVPKVVYRVSVGLNLQLHSSHVSIRGTDAGAAAPLGAGDDAAPPPERVSCPLASLRTWIDSPESVRSVSA